MADIENAGDLPAGRAVEKLPRGVYAGQELQVLGGGIILPSTFGEVIEYAQMMAKAGVAVPKHLRDNPGACMAVIQRSMAWRMDPWAVATKTYLVNDIIAYEAQLIAAVVMTHAPIKERVIVPHYSGDATESLVCTFLVHHRETGEEIPYESPKKKEITVQNSPLWKSDPRQQLFYYSIRAMARRFFPALLLGVYDPEEARAMVDITPKRSAFEDGDDDEVITAPRAAPTVAAIENKPEVAMEPVRQPDSAFVEAPERMKAHVEEMERLNQHGIETPTDVFEQASDLFDKVTGEVQEPESVEEEQRPEPEPTITPDMIFANMVKAVKGFSSEKMLDEWIKDSQPDIGKLTPERQKELRKAIADKRIDLEPL